ncbi:MAG: zinc ribbon domain-containing protein [Proteobacteria bacterium]|nr:zinc ribbon domain-containing protein [Pseudomonadota bacterium]
MPIYEYECTDCGKRFEIFQRITDKPLSKCKFCKGPLSKLISSCSFRLKGTGWYATDYKKPVDAVGKKASSGNGEDHADTVETASAASTDTKSDAKSDTKSDAKTDTKTVTKTESASA